MTAFLLSFLIRSSLLGLLGLVTLWLIRKQSASVRHAVAVGTVCAMAALPLLAYLLPTRTVEVAAVPDALVYLSVAKAQTAGTPIATAAAGPSLDWLVPALWVGVAGFLWLRLITGYVLMRRRVSKGRVLQLGHAARIVEDPGAKVPMMLWMRRHIILLPGGWPEWPSERLEYVLDHEEAHIQRGDWFTHIFVRLATSAMWLNPLAHVLSRKISALAEEAADDLVISSGADPSGYATALLEIARGAATTPAYAVHAVPMAAQSNVARRIEMILNNNRKRGAVSVRVLILSALLITAVSTPVASWALEQGKTSQVYKIGMNTPVMILNQKAVQEDLDLTTTQVQTIDSLLKRFQESGSNRPASAEALITGLEGVPSAVQKARLRQIFIQWRKTDMVLDAEIQAELGMNAGQKQKVAAIAKSFMQANNEVNGSGTLSPDEKNRRFSKNSAAYAESLSKVLTPSQMSTLTQLGGTPFDGAIMGTIWTQLGC